jgi:hypothetical protein
MYVHEQNGKFKKQQSQPINQKSIRKKENGNVP